MTNEEAYDVISEMIHLNLLTPQESEALKIANEVLHKFLPKKPKVIDNDEFITYICPRCHCVIKYTDTVSGKSYYYMQGYGMCNCGQEIDLMEIDER